MRIGTVREIKSREYRVGLTPSGVKTFAAQGHEVRVQAGAGAETGFSDREYESAGARLAPDAASVYGACDMVLKVKEPLPEEFPLLRPGLILYTYLHLAANEALTRELLARKVKGVAYETIETADGTLPCLKPMSEIAGRLSVQEGAKYLEKTYGGRGVLLGGVPGVRRGRVTIIGGGVVGTNACKIAVGLGADVTLLDIRADRLAYLDDIFGSRMTTLYSTEANLERVLQDSDLVIGAVLVPGAKAPRVLRRSHLKLMKPGAVIVDVAVDQGGCVETTRPTTHDDPVFIVDGIVHYCVANMPGAVALTSTEALTSTTLPYGLQIAREGLETACRNSDPIRRGVNTYEGHCVNSGVAEAFGIPFQDLSPLIR
jgi:alanine dehydrogenase